MDYSIFPPINASLNATAGVFLALGFWAVKRNRLDLHRRLMICALACSTVFLSGYLFYHFNSGLTHYQHTGWIRWLYFTILITHTPLAVIIVPFIFAAVYFAIKGQFDKHTRITRWLFPVWMYVSVTGVIIYVMLYQF